MRSPRGKQRVHSSNFKTVPREATQILFIHRISPRSHRFPNIQSKSLCFTWGTELIQNLQDALWNRRSQKPQLFGQDTSHKVAGGLLFFLNQRAEKCPQPKDLQNIQCAISNGSKRSHLKSRKKSLPLLFRHLLTRNYNPALSKQCMKLENRLMSHSLATSEH